MPQELSYAALAEKIKTLEKALAKEKKSTADLLKILSSKKNSEKTLSESENKYRMLFESMRNGICFVEAIYDDFGKLCDARYLEMNAVYAKFTGLNKETAVNRTVMKMLPGTEKSWFDTLEPVAKSGKTVQFEMFHGNTGKWYAVSAYSPRKDTLVVVFRDTTRSKRAEEALKKSDNGAGISAEDEERIFEPFYSKKVMGRSGSGLGLTVVWNSLQDHNGYVNVSSRQGGGTEFELYFPASMQAKKDLQEPVHGESIQGAGQSILVVDDDENQRKIGVQILSSLGYRVETAESGEAAIEYLENNVFDLIVLDMIMAPGINGRQTYEAIVRKQPGQKAIIVSGFAETKDVKEALRLGAGAFVKKPYTVEKIGWAIKRELMV